jgi:hypothetical protein
VRHAVAVVDHLDASHRVHLRTADHDIHRCRFGVERVPDQLGHGRERLRRLAQFVELVRSHRDRKTRRHL